MSKRVDLLPHQLEAVNRLDSGKILCGGVGTGKSLTALAYFLRKEKCGIRVPLYIITTARKRDTKEWEQEQAKFDFNDISVTVDSWNNIHRYDSIKDAFFIFDEQRVVGKGAWVKSFLKIAKANRWILLTATPGDTWSDYIPVFLANGFYKNRGEFLKRHAVFNPYSKYPKIDRWLEVGFLEWLRRRITVTMKFEKKTKQHWEDVYVEFDISLYNQIAKDRWNPWDDCPIVEISSACYLMRRAVNDDERRLDVIKGLMKAHPKAIIFYNYDYELERLRGLSPEIDISEWNGHNHQSIPDGEQWGYLVQYSAGCEGWNCTTTDTIIFYSQSYSYKTMTQAAGRIDRMNTPYSDLYYYTLKSRSPIDIAIGKALKGKKNFNERIFMESL